MNIFCVGTDPAGLYLAILLRSADASHRICILDTGSDEPCPAHLIDNPLKPPLHLADDWVQTAIDGQTAAMNGVNVTRDGEETSTEGQKYRAISAQRLTVLLRDRAQMLGCRFEPAEPGAEPEECDLVIVADGAASMLRARHAAAFQPSLSASHTRYRLFDKEPGSDRMALRFRRTPHGLFHAFSYPSGAARCSIIVEARESTLRAAGLDEAPLARSAEFLAELFGEDRSWSSRNDWRPFVTVRNRCWRAGNKVLLGRAAYSAHFSVGLDMRASLEDAELLASLLIQGIPVEQALAQFEAARRPHAESLQRAAAASLGWLEQADDHAAMDFDQFAFACLTRSMRITHTHLKHAAPALVQRVDRLIAGEANDEPVPPMFAPFRLRGLTIPNRVAVSPMCMYSAVDGTVNDFHLVHLGSRAQGGAGLILTEMADVAPEGRISLHCAGMYAPEHGPAWRRVVEFVHRHSDAKIGIQLGHAGRKAALTRSWDGHEPLGTRQWEILAPSPIAFSEQRQVPKEMDRADMDRIAEAFVAATRQSDEAGFDMIELHMAHGYLLSSFISPLSNRRTDQYGGDLANRMRYPLEIFSRVRAVWPDDKPISVRISAIDWVDGGTTIEDAIEIGRMLQQAGADIIAVSTGAVTNHRRPMVGRLFQTGFSDRIRNALQIPTMAVGGVASWSDANSIIAAGRADLCLLARGALYDPYFVRHAAHEQGIKLAWPGPYNRAEELEMHQG